MIHLPDGLTRERGLHLVVAGDPGLAEDDRLGRELFLQILEQDWY